MGRPGVVAGSLAGIFVYPLKGGRGFSPRAWPIEPSGLRLDRRWMIVDAGGRSVTQLTTTRLALVETAVDSGMLVLKAPGLEALRCAIEPPAAQERTKALMNGNEEVWASAAASELDEWFSSALDMECRVVYGPQAAGRWVDRNPDGGVPLNFQNAFPVHLVSQASLDDLNERLAVPVSMDRFRPNLVIAGTEPHEDDGWKRIQIGETILRIGRACDHRCGVPNIDQQTGERAVEPLRTLATFRRSERGIYFGQNVAIERGGELRVGDKVTVLGGKR